MDINNLISECTAYDYKSMLEEKRPKSWLKSVSAFANGQGGSLFFGIDDNGGIIGLDDVQHVSQSISTRIRDLMDPLPDVELIPHEVEGKKILQVKVSSGHYTPYYYIGDGQRMAFIRVGDESLPATAEQMVRLVLKGSNKTYDSLLTDYKEEDNTFIILANTFKTRTNQEWNKKFLLSFGLITNTGVLTNAGALFADDCPLWQSRLYCTRWDGNDKSDAINDAEFTGNILLLLREAMNFVKSNTKKGWEKLPDGRKNKPEYAERAVLEAMVNHFIHRDYTVMGGEVHLDIYDDRLTVTSPGGMYNGSLIQDLDIAEVSSERRNPILANVMAQLDYMEKRGSGLTRICNETKALDGYKDELKPVFKSTPTQFQTIIYATSGASNVGENVGEMSEREITDRQQHILNLIKEYPTITAKQMSERLSVTQRTIERDIAILKKKNRLKRNGNDYDGEWIIL
jgi:ATP-dependent DNA helicase RecG